MKQLTVGNILKFIAELQAAGMSIKEIAALPVYLGDDELNGIHCGWYTNILDVNNDDEDNQYLIELISDDCCMPLKNKGILIS